MALNSKAKGSTGEHEVIRLLTGWAIEIGVTLKLERNLEQVRSGGADISGVPGFEVEVKRVEATGINQWWAQVCRAAAKTGKRPMLCHRRNRQQWQFRVGLQVYELAPTGAAYLVPLGVDLDYGNAKIWFQQYIKHSKGEIN